ncbi:MAG: protein-tyrosine-phosphatase [Bacteroidetes bacterium]|nr:protein-tyrosine-phosphatase [Bacteroidota bacterium]MBU1115948.1 protein-tyrosine-phosphatase [Bacteroidota bacterium]MBU1798455.1 protein-tyrosine-phosphatase [Bacteroidota bacterium]
MTIYEPVKNEILKLLKTSYTISEERKNLLNNFAEYISKKINNGTVVNLIFICTHNSRRSTMSQIWAQTAAEYFNIPNINCFSGGTEATAFNPRAVKAVQNFGFKVEQKDESENPIYLVHFSDENEPIKCFSKVYSDKFNPQNNFAAIMTCSDADANCPLVLGAEARFPVKYNDPKEYDDTDFETQKYSERFEQIGIEMLYTFSRIKQ